MKISKFVTAIVTTALLSIHQNPVNATVNTYVIDSLNDGDVDQYCKSTLGSNSYVTSFNPTRSASVCILNYGTEINGNVEVGGSFGTGGGSVNGSVGGGGTIVNSDTNHSVQHDDVCRMKYQNWGYSNPRWDWNSQACIGEADIVAQQPEANPQSKVVGSIGHNQFWAFCSGSGYRSYYDQGYTIQCGFQDWVSGQPEGDYFDYQDVCKRTYSSNAFYSDQSRACESY